MADNEYSMFHDENETDQISYKNRINQLYSFRKNIKSLIEKDSFQPTGDYTKFLRLKALDSKKSDVIESNIATSVSSPITASTLSDEESAAIEEAVDSMKASEFIQLFLDSYMAPIGSDIDYRLGKVVGIKTYLYNDGGYTYPESEAFGQYDKYGRIDTTLNLRLSVDIPGLGATGDSYSNLFNKYKKNVSVIPPTTENYVNLFFPPFTFGAFSDSTSLSTNADRYILTRKWNSVAKKWEYEDDFDPDSVTFDTGKLLSMRKNPTYRLPAYKAINDNIMFLQHIFEQTCGIVSTYLTEWDISLYIQEGLLSGKENKAPSYLTLTNRIMKDNPSGYTDSRAFVYGALNCAVSKTPIDVPVPNLSDWIPSSYPLSVYWLPYKSINRGDGLDVFYDVALNGFNCKDLTMYHRGDGHKYTANSYEKLSFREKVMRDDQMGAAFSGWMNWNTLKYWQALYTTSSDGLGSIDIIHMNIDESSSKFEDTQDDEGNDVEGIVSQIIEALYNENDLSEATSINDIWTEETTFTDSNGDPITVTKRYRRSNKAPYDSIYLGCTYSNGNDSTKDKEYDSNDKEITQSSSSSSNSTGDIRVMGVSIPGSRILKIFLKRSSSESKAMNIANKQQSKSYSSASSSSNNNTSSNSSNGTSGSDVVSMVDADVEENGKYARTDGVSQWSPVLYGGPHGKNYSPKTIEGYFETDNEFLRNVPRICPSNISDNPKVNFNGVEGRYSPKLNNVTGAEPYRSPSRCFNLLSNGHFDYTLQKVYCLRPKWFWSSTPYGYINGNEYWMVDSGWQWEETETGYLTPISFMCNPYNNDYYPNCSHRYWNAEYEWNNWTKYARYYGKTRNNSDEYYLSYYKNYWGRMKNVCMNTTSRYGKLFKVNTTRGTTDAYQIIGVKRMKKYYCRYNQWENYYFKRPLMHSNPNATNSSYWNINCGYRSNSVFCKWYDSESLLWKYRNLFMKSSVDAKSSVNSDEITLAYTSDGEGYRLTFPKSGVSYHRCTGNGGCDIRTKEEQNFLEYVTGNSTDDWHNVYFFQSALGTSMSDRRENGPVSVFRVPVRRNHYSAPFSEWRLVKRAHRKRCKTHWDSSWELFTTYGWVPYIEVDMKNVKEVWSGIKSEGLGGVSAWNNLSATLLAGDNQESIIDVPPGVVGKTILPDTPFGYSGRITPQIWASMKRGTEEYGIHGWGYATAIPGMNYNDIDPEGRFENPNDYLNLPKVLGDDCKYIRISELCKKIPFYTLNNKAALRYLVPEEYAGHNVLSAQGVKSYERIPYIDPGLAKMFQNLYCTSTFFKYNEKDIDDYLNPRLITNDNGLRTLIRIANHQSAWMKQAKKIFCENVDFNEVTRIIQNTVNKSILAKSLSTSDSRDTTSVLYHYWIDKAYDIFSDETNKVYLLNEFSRRINVLDQFLKEASEYVDKTAYEWSYDDYSKIYNMIGTLKEATINYVDIETNKSSIIEEYMYAYLNVLYEYRKFYINKRCNKVDGTLNNLKELEGAIPLVCQTISDIDPAGSGRTNTIFDSDSHTYKVSYYDIDNSNISKIKSMISNESLNEDRTMLLYVKVKYAENMSVVRDFLRKCKNGTLKPTDQRYIWVPKKQKYAELPFDDIYRYESKEYKINEAAKLFNEKASTLEKRQLNSKIDDCVFNIKWSDWGTMDKIQTTIGASAKQQLRNQLDYEDAFPYVYYESSDWKSRLNIQKNSTKIPMIKYDVQSGVDPSKLIEAQTAMNSDNSDSISAYDIMCTIGSKSDYWVIAIPKEARPRAVGYVSNLMLKSYRSPETETQPNAQTVATAGAFGYALYPITEEQANTIPGIGLDMAGIQADLQNSYLENLDSNVSSLPTSD